MQSEFAQAKQKILYWITGFYLKFHLEKDKKTHFCFKLSTLATSGFEWIYNSDSSHWHTFFVLSSLPPSFSLTLSVFIFRISENLHNEQFSLLAHTHTHIKYWKELRKRFISFVRLLLRPSSSWLSNWSEESAIVKRVKSSWALPESN